MSIWTEILAHNPRFLWKLTETSGVVAADSAPGGAAPATYTASPVLDQVALLPNVPTEKAPYFGGGGSNSGWVSGDLTGDASGVGVTDFTMLMWIKPETLGTQRALGGKSSHVQLYLNADGTLLFLASPAFDTFATLIADALVANNMYGLAFRKRAGMISIHINGVKKAETAHASNLSNSGSNWRFGNMTGPLFRGWGLGVAVFTATSLTDAEILALYTRSISAPDEQPSAPTITAPVAAQVVDDLLIVMWTPSTDPEGSPLQYEGRYSLDNGVSWLPLFALQSATSYEWNIASFEYNTEMKVQVRAHDGVNYGDYDTSAAFTIEHLSAFPILSNLTVANRTDYSVLATVDFYDPDTSYDGEHDATNWQIWEGATLKYDSGWDTVHTASRWFTSLPPGTDLLICARGRDKGGQIGLWTDFVPFRTRRILLLASLAGGDSQHFNQTRNEGVGDVLNKYGQLLGGIGFFPVNPELIIADIEAKTNTSGVRLNWASSQGDYVQPSSPTGDGATLVQYQGNGLGTSAHYVEAGARYKPRHSFVLEFTPHYNPVGNQYNLMFGSEVWWVYRSGTNIIIGPYGIGPIVYEERNLLIFSYDHELVNEGCFLFGFEYIVQHPGYLSLTLVNSSGEYVFDLGSLYGANPSLIPNQFYVEGADGCEGGPGESRRTTIVGFPVGAPVEPPSHNYLYLGSQSSDGARDINSTNYYSYSGIFHQFALWPDHALTPTEVESLKNAWLLDETDALYDVIMPLEPFLYDRFHQPQPPRAPAGAVVQV